MALTVQREMIGRSFRDGLVSGLVIGSIESVIVLFQGGLEFGFLEAVHFILLAMVLYGAGGGAVGALCGGVVAAGIRLLRRLAGETLVPRLMRSLPRGLMAGGLVFIYLRLYYFKEHTIPMLFGLIILFSLVFFLLGKSTATSRAPGAGLKRPGLLLGVLAACWILSFFPLSLDEGPRPTGGVAGKQGPNVVIFTLDTLRADHLGCMGYKKIKTPVLDGLAEKGLLFTRNICQQPITTASHASLFTSTHPITNGVEGNNIPLDPSATTLAEILEDQGYFNAAFVSGYPVTAHASGLDQGFHHYDDRIFIVDHLPGAVPELSMRLSALRALEKFMAAGHLLIHLQRRGDRTNRAALEWLDTVGENPFFVWIHYFDPHTPYDPPPPYDTMYDPDYRGSADGSMKTIYKIWDGKLRPSPADVAHIVSLYDGEISFTDSLVGRIVGKLERMKALDDTILVVGSDHGESLWEHDYHFKHGDFLYDSCVRTPLIINLPGEWSRSKKIDHPTENIDIVPTILEILGIPRPESMQGKSLLGLVRGDNTYKKDHGLSQAVGKRHESYKIERKRYCIRTEEWKWIRNQGESDELYHLGRDPEESIDRLAEHPELAREFNERLDAILSLIRKSGREIAPPDKETLERLKSLGYIK